ncbi:serine protein kinase RIO, partial [Candidatus Woesearchaeota archaeon]
MPKITREKFKVYEGVFDNFTIKNLIALMKKGIVSEGTLSPVKIGKEANVFSGENDLGEKLILKIYRLETANFNRMYEYIRTDPRFVGL